MAETWAHIKDTGKAIGTTLSEKARGDIENLVHFVIDGQKTRSRVIEQQKADQEAFKKYLDGLGIYGVTPEWLCREFQKQGVDLNQIDTRYGGNKILFIYDWILPPGGPAHQVYTHKGWDYNYAEESDKDYWSALETHQSWMVKKNVFIKVVQEAYHVSYNDAERMAVLLYTVHRLRDLQYNGTEDTTPKQKEYLFNIVDDTEKYILPLVKNNPLHTKITEAIEALKKGIDELRRSGPNWNWDGILAQADALLGSVDDDTSGHLDEVIPAFIREQDLL
jgi:hypothetical protein